MAKIRIRESTKDIQKEAKLLCEAMLSDLEKAKRPVLEAVKCSLDNSFYNSKVGFLTPGEKVVKTELNVSSVQKMTRTIFMLEILLEKLQGNAAHTKREYYYIVKGTIKKNPELRALDFDDQPESDAIIDFICDMLEVYREEMNCFANDRGGQTYSKNLIVTETLADGKIATVDLGSLGTTPFQPKNKPQQFRLKPKKGKLDFCLVIESEGTANTLVANGMHERHNCIILGAQGVPSNGVRGWCKTIQDQLKLPMYFYGDLDAYTLQNIFRTLKAGSAASLIRNSDFSAPDVKFLGVLPEDVKRLDLNYYDVNDRDVAEARSLKKAKDALENDPFFKDKKNKKLADILHWLVKEKKRCEQQAVFSVDPKDPLILEKVIIDKIKRGSYV